LCVRPVLISIIFTIVLGNNRQLRFILPLEIGQAHEAQPTLTAAPARQSQGRKSSVKLKADGSGYRRGHCGNLDPITTPTNLMGIDVGFSKTRPTTGIACLEGDQLSLGRAGPAWESRETKIPKGFHPSVIAIDGPLLPQGAPHDIRRHVESVFIRAPFHNRCRPGLSHHGVGLELRQASGDACTQFGRILAHPVLGSSSTVCRKGPIVEAFPNAFLGVLMPEVELLAAPRFKRGRRFDWLYERMVTTGRLESLLSQNSDLPDVVWQRLRSETDHELRAALICLLTVGRSTGRERHGAIIGEVEGGWFWLPPWSLWEPWARNGLETASKRMESKLTSVLDRPLPLQTLLAS
jgi:hypothetical protein